MFMINAIKVCLVDDLIVSYLNLLLFGIRKVATATPATLATLDNININIVAEVAAVAVA